MVFFVASPAFPYTTLKTRSKAEYKLPYLRATAGLPHDLNTCIQPDMDNVVVQSLPQAAAIVFATKSEGDMEPTPNFSSYLVG